MALDLRAGFYSDPLPFIGPRDPNQSPDPDTNLIIATQDRRFVTVGAGLLVDEAVHVDLAWTRGTFEVKEGPLEEDNTLSRAVFGVNYRF